MVVRLRNALQNQINLALDGEMSWESLASILNELTSTSDRMKTLIEILLETLKTTNERLKSFESSDQVVTNEDFLKQSEVEDSKDFPKTLINHDATGIEKYQNIEQESSKFHCSTDVNGKKIVVPQLTLKKVQETHKIVPKEDQKSVPEVVQPKIELNPDDFQYIVGDFEAKNQSDIKQESIDEDFDKLDSEEEIAVKESPKLVKIKLQKNQEPPKVKVETENIKEQIAETIVDENDEEKFKCKVCGKIVKHLNAHMVVHSQDKPYKCKLCNFSCNRSGNLRVHEQGHKTETPYKCDFCDKEFNIARKLTMHARIHDRPLQCPHCSKIFSEKSQENSHRM